MIDHLGPGEQRVEIGGDHVLEGNEPVAVLAHPKEAPEQLLRHLDPGDDLVAAVGVAEQHPEAERKVGDVWEGPAEADHQRRQRREDLLVEVPVDLRPLGLARRGEGDDPDPLLLQGRAQGPVKATVEPGVELEHPFLDRIDLLTGREPVGAACVDPGVDLVEQPRDPDHEELIEVGGVDRAELDPLEKRDRGLLGQLQHPLVEVEPGELPVEVERRVLEVGALPIGSADRGLDGLGADLLFEHCFS